MYMCLGDVSRYVLKMSVEKWYLRGIETMALLATTDMTKQGTQLGSNVWSKT